MPATLFSLATHLLASPDDPLGCCAAASLSNTSLTWSVLLCHQWPLACLAWHPRRCWAALLSGAYDVLVATPAELVAGLVHAYIKVGMTVEGSAGGRGW